MPYSRNGRTRSWRYTYTSMGEVVTVTDPQGHLTSDAYDAGGALNSITNALGQVT